MERNDAWTARAGALGSIAVAAAFLLLWPVHNGYPFVFSDTGAYIASGWTHVVPPDRPITYGLFLRWTSLGITLWLPAVIQALLTAWAVRASFGSKVPAWVTPVTIGFLALTTGLATRAGLLIPDIFTGIAVLLLALMLTAPSLSRGQWLGLGALLVLSLVVHMSHLLIGFALVLAASAFAVAAPAAAARFGLSRGRSLLVGALVLASALLVPAVHRHYGGGFTWSRFSHVFTMGRMAENGVLAAFLDEACPTRRYRLCEYRAALPIPAWMFIWLDDSPMALTGGPEANRAEYDEIIGQTLRRPRFLAMQVRKGIEGAALQLVRFEAPGLLGYGPDTPPYTRIRRFVPRELPSYQASRQMNGLRFGWINAVQPWVVLVSLVAIGAALLSPGLRRRLSGSSIGWIALVLLGVVANAVVCGALSSPDSRYGSRIIWVVPLAAIVLFATRRYGAPPPAPG